MHRHNVFHNKRKDHQRQKNHLCKLYLQHLSTEIKDTSRTPYSRRQQTRLSWRPKFPISLPPQRKNPYQQHHLTRQIKHKIHVHWHQELLSGKSYEVFPIHAHPQKIHSPIGTRQIRHHLRRPIFHLRGYPQRHVRPKRSRRHRFSNKSSANSNFLATSPCPRPPESGDITHTKQPSHSVSTTLESSTSQKPTPNT